MLADHVKLQSSRVVLDLPISAREVLRADATDNVTEAIKRRAKAQRELDELNKKSAVAGSVPLLQEITRAAAEIGRSML